MDFKENLLMSFDCVKDYDSSQYFGHENIKVVSNLGLIYREAGDTPSSRFGYRFQIKNVGKPHKVVVTYPHDKQRFMCVLDGTCYDLNSGLVTGKVLPLSNKMETLEVVFWPRWKDCSITIMTYSHGEPAAAASIDIYELSSLPELSESNTTSQSDLLKNNSDSKLENRWFGMQFEDPCGSTASVGAKDHFEWTEHIIDYAKHSGQNLLIYPLLWYHGPLYPSEVEIPDITEIYVASDRKQYVQWSTKPFDWYQKMLQRFEEEGLSFIGSLTLLRLSSLMKNMNIDIESIKNGEETYNNMLENNRVKGSTGDWTRIHHASNYEKIVAKIGQDDIIDGFRMPKGEKEAYGENQHWSCRGGPMFNPLHPKVQKSIMNFIQEIGERYKEFSALKGISINIYASTFLWFGNLRLGYDDYTIALFEKETNITISVNKESKNRFRKRYKFILKHYKEEWINWRCQKIRDLIREIRDLLKSIRQDYKLIITLWDETVFLPSLGVIGKKHQIGTRMSNYDFYREGGIDINLFQDENDILLDLNIGCTRDRGGHSPDATAGINIKPEHSSMYRDFDFLDDKKNTAHANLKSPGTYNFNCWIESWGKYKWFQPPKDDINIKDAKLMDGKPVDGMIACNSLYPDDGFWFDSQLRIVPTYLGGIHYLEPFANSLAEFDSIRITSGGLFLDSAHTHYKQKFSSYFTALPAKKFGQIGNSTDPVAVRSLKIGDIQYFYVVNRDFNPIKITIEFNPNNIGSKANEYSENQIVDLVTHENLELTEKNPTLSMELEPYELRAWYCSSNIEIIDFSVKLEEKIINNLRVQAQNAIKILDNLIKSKNFRKSIVQFNIKGKNDDLNNIKYTKGIIEDCLKHNKYSKLHRALNSYAVRKFVNQLSVEN